MKFAKTGIVAAAVLTVASVVFAQTKPDFSGAWTPDTAAAAAPTAGTTGTGTGTGTTGAGTTGAGAAGAGQRGGGRAMPGPMTVTQTATTLTIERTRGENKIVSTYKLDGTESVNKQTTPAGEVEIKSTAKWDGAKLVITTQRPGQDGALVTSTETWSMDGANLKVDSTRPGREGNPMTASMVYKKTT